jgi:hypothetical protein
MVQTIFDADHINSVMHGQTSIKRVDVGALLEWMVKQSETCVGKT